LTQGQEKKTMQLRDLVKNISTMTDAELQEHVRSIRHNKYVARPAAAKRRADENKKTTRVTTNKIDKAIAGLTAEQRADLIKQLGG
jgi:hypothetical protein